MRENSIRCVNQHSTALNTVLIPFRGISNLRICFTSGISAVRSAQAVCKKKDTYIMMNAVSVRACAVCLVSTFHFGPFTIYAITNGHTIAVNYYVIRYDYAAPPENEFFPSASAFLCVCDVAGRLSSLSL